MDEVSMILKRLRTYRPEKIIIFGSYARGESDEYSDLDFIVIKNTKKRFIKRLIDVGERVGTEFGKVDIFVYTPSEFEEMKKRKNPFIEEALREGKVLYEKS